MRRVCHGLLACALLSGAASVERDATRDVPGTDAAHIGEPEVQRRLSAGSLPSDERIEDPRVRRLVALARAELAMTTDATRSTNARTDGSASLTVGLLYHLGMHLPADAALAEHLFERAAALGNDAAALALAWCALEGCGRPPDLEAFDRLLPAARAANRARSEYFRYERMRRAAGGELTPEALAVLRGAATLGDPIALNELGIVEVEGGRYEAAFTAFERAASAGSRVAKENLRRARTVAQEIDRRARTAQPSPPTPPTDGRDAGNTDIRIEQRGAESSLDAQRAYERVRELHRAGASQADYARAIEGYRDAAAKGSERARRMLAIILSRLLPDGGIDPAWMRQTSLLDIEGDATTVRSGASTFLREPSAIVDLLPDVLREDSLGRRPVEPAKGR